MIDSVAKLAARAMCKLPPAVLERLNGEPLTIDGQTMDPLVQFMTKTFSDDSDELKSLSQTRRDFDSQGGWLGYDPVPTVDVVRHSMSGPNGQVPIAIYRPADAPSEGAPALLFFHGGGHSAGSLTSHHAVCVALADRAEMVVVAVDYRLAPEHKFPAGINDCIASYDGLVERADEYGIDADRIAIGGDSAGANVAAVLAQQLRNRAQPPKYQIMWVPWVDLSTKTASYELFSKGFFLEEAKLDWYIDNYFDDPSDARNTMASPLLGDVTGCCPAALLIAGFDPLRDEGIAYGEKLAAAGVDTDMTVYAGLTHPFVNTAGHVPAATEAFNDAIALLKANV